VAPRYFARGGSGIADDPGDRWQETAIPLPADSPASYRDIFSGREISADRVGGECRLAAAAVLACFPLALLTAGTD
jgi:hypothetical protein